MSEDDENKISYKKWTELTSEDILLYENEKLKSIMKWYEMFGDEMGEEESENSNSKKKKPP